MGERRRLGLLVFCTMLALLVALPAVAMAAENGSRDNKYYYGNVVNTGLDNGYAGANTIKQDDPHFGWKLGEFVVTGFTSRTSDDTPVFLKNAGDQVELSFNLQQNIDALNGSEDVKIGGDGDGYDEYFGVPKSDFGRGTLIVRHTDYQNASTDPQIYTDYLPALEVGADTHIDMFEEGDYEVALDYEIESPGLIPFRPAYNNYRIYFKYKVRNSNTMMFLFDTATNDELFNGSVTANGFRIDMAGSHYLDVSVKKEVLNNTGDGLTEDTRFNKAATDGAIFDEEGIYTVTVKNPNTGEEPTVKRIYVGKDDVLKASVANDMPIADVESQIAQGATVADDGSLVLANVKMDASQAHDEKGDSSTSNTTEQTQNKGGGLPIAPIVIVVVVVVALVAFFVMRGKERPIEKSSKAHYAGDEAPDDKPASDSDGGEGAE